MDFLVSHGREMRQRILESPMVEKGIASKMIRIKFVCASVKKYQSSTWNPKTQKNGVGFLYSYELYLVPDVNDMDEQFIMAAPSGVLNLSTARDDLFVVGKSYYLNFNEVIA